MQDRIFSFTGLLTIAFITTFSFTQVSLEIKNVRNNAGVALSDSDFSCSNSALTSQPACEAVGVCNSDNENISGAQYTDKSTCVAASSCSISDYTTQSTCVAGGTCSDTQYSTLSDCSSNGSCSDGTSTAITCSDAGGDVRAEFEQEKSESDKATPALLRTFFISSETCVKLKVVIKAIVSNPVKENILSCINISPCLINLFLSYYTILRNFCANLFY
jgi:hypothetical protein